MEQGKNHKEIHVGELISIVLSKKRFIILFAISFFILGVFVAVLKTSEYTAETVFIPQIESKSGDFGGDLGGLASLAGIELGGSLSGGTDFPPTLYPELLQNIHLQFELLNSNIYVEDIGDSVSYRIFYDSLYKPGALNRIAKYTIGLPFVIIQAIKGSEPAKIQESNEKYPRIDSYYFDHIKRLNEQINLKPDLKAGYVSLSFVMNDPDHAAQMAGHAEKLIHKALVDFRIDKLNQELRYLESTYEKKKNEFIASQNALSEFKDSNFTLTTAASKDMLDRLQNTYDMNFELYRELAASLERKKIEKSKNTPLIKTIKPIVVPFRRSSPNRPVLVISFALFGVALSAGIVLFRPLFGNYFEFANKK